LELLVLEHKAVCCTEFVLSDTYRNIQCWIFLGFAISDKIWKSNLLVYAALLEGMVPLSFCGCAWFKRNVISEIPCSYAGLCNVKCLLEGDS
jgi:hypothetical protein